MDQDETEFWKQTTEVLKTKSSEAEKFMLYLILSSLILILFSIGAIDITAISAGSMTMTLKNKVMIVSVLILIQLGMLWTFVYALSGVIFGSMVFQRSPFMARYSTMIGEQVEIEWLKKWNKIQNIFGLLAIVALSLLGLTALVCGIVYVVRASM
jgi:hypothetical protein